MWEIGQALPVTVQLSLAALVFAVVVGLLIGVLAGRYPRSALDTGSMVGVLVGVSMQVFWTGILLLLVFGGMLGWLPLGGIIDGSLAYRRITGAPLLDGLVAGNWTIVRSSVRHLVLPAVGLGSTAMAALARIGPPPKLDGPGPHFIPTPRRQSLAARRPLNPAA